MASLTKAAWAALLAFAGLAASPRPAPGQEADSHALVARLFDEAGQAQDRRAYDEACPKFARVVELDPAKVGAKLALADCYEQAGKLASAAAAYRTAAARAAEAGDARSKMAEAKVVELEAKAPRVVILVSEALRSLPGLTVLCDGAPLDASQYTRPVLSDPGEHAIYVGAPGKKPWSGKVTVLAGATVEIVIGGLEDLSAALPAGAPPAPASAPGDPIAGGTPPREVPVWTWVTGGLGLASGGVAVAFAVDQAAAQQDFDARCKTPPPEAGCGDRAARLWRDFGLWIGLGTAGVAGIAAATIGVATASRRRAQAPVRASFWIEPHGSGAALLGRF